VAVHLCSYTVSLYPVVDETMEVHERAHAFHVNKAALSLQTIPIWLQLDALGNQLNLAVTMDGVIHNWLRRYQDGWYNFKYLKVLSFRDVKGDIITNTKARNGPTISLGVLNGNFVDCCKQNIKFVQCNSVLTFLLLQTQGDNPFVHTFRGVIYWVAANNFSSDGRE
jgi:hypothetical protein